MMDPNETNLPLEEGMLEENKTVVAETVTDGQPSDTEETLNTEETEALENETLATYVLRETREEVIARLKEIAEEGDVSGKAELDFLKLNFYKLHRAAHEAAMAAWVEAGNEAEAYVPEHDSLEDEYKEVMGVIKQKRNALLEQQEAEREENLQKKLVIIERLKNISEGIIDNNAYNEVKQIQQEWKEIGNIPAGKVNEVWKSYQLQMEKFYDLLKLNNEFREYDFKKNLENKVRLCESAERLAEEEDVVSAFHQLQKLHQDQQERLHFFHGIASFYFCHPNIFEWTILVYQPLTAPRVTPLTKYFCRKG